ncbi:helix-turn-helix domain-containing protein [Terrabacter sp. MAHUQ-38]|jgi:protein-tyrosine-phosphatase|uniref:arsenate reductase/protein-tyrosine-phosphatase family protein n=1 Tax=unclassified Terrabacter TaxID=2630222 RepID=UPI00165D5446|nr:helix-turn-helix domain-containing protein [Terrabacter sp. MAHUQ-38]MBC9823852.1 helix-turn-helix domain-containing protein [Terrabacter sp. MAHUQ-38]
MNAERTSPLERRADVHAALADVSRLQIVDHLAVTDASASEIGVELGLPSNLLAHHLKVLERVGLVTRRRSEGDARRWYYSLAVGDCVADPAGGPRRPTRIPQRLLFVCTANTARSHLAAALWRRASGLEAGSAGTHPGEAINPRAIATAARHDLDLPQVAPCRLDDASRPGDLLITVCDRAHEELRGLAWAHWSIPDPVPDGSDDAFDRAVEDLASRVESLAPRLTASA